MSPVSPALQEPLGKPKEGLGAGGQKAKGDGSGATRETQASPGRDGSSGGYVM